MNTTLNNIYKPTAHIRMVTAGSLFDGHDAAINIMRRIMQSTGAEIIHLGHNRSVQEIINCAIQEDVQGIAVTSYQGGHVEYFKYMYDLLKEKGAGHIKLFGGGGGTILPSEIDELHQYGITRIYSPDDGRELGLQGMINDVIRQCDYDLTMSVETPVNTLDTKTLARLITLAENEPNVYQQLKNTIISSSPYQEGVGASPVLGITGTGGAGKSSLVDELIRRFLLASPDKTLAVISIDPSKRKTGGALLGDRIRMNAINTDRIYMRSLATRQANLAMSPHVQDAIELCQKAGYDLIIVETSGIGQSDTEITEVSDLSLYVMTAEYGAATQLEKIDMIDFADVIAINKFDKRGSLDALRDVRKQYRRSCNNWEAKDEQLPVFGTVASQFNDVGTNQLFAKIMQLLAEKTTQSLVHAEVLNIGMTDAATQSHKASVIPPERNRYLAEIVENSERYQQFVEEQISIARKLYQLKGGIELVGKEVANKLQEAYNELETQLNHECKTLLQQWTETKAIYKDDTFKYKVRDKVIELDLYTETLSGLKVPKVSLPRFEDWGDILRWLLTENVPGSFPYSAGVFPLKRDGEDPARMFAGEGGPERTNKRFHYVSKGLPAKRLSTAFDSVTLYGEDPDYRPDIYGKIGNSGVSVCNLDDAKKLYSGFNLCDPTTSVSMTINGPAPMVLSFFLNAAIDQQCELYLKRELSADDLAAKLQSIKANCSYQGNIPDGNNGLGLMLLGTTGDKVLSQDVYQKIKADTLRQVRGTVQADILKEDQAQNTCIFSTEFALRMMGDIQQYFVDNQIRNFYSVSISGYHIAEAGANPISQLAFTLANGFTFVEYYLSRGMSIDDFAPNFSFFFSNGMDAEYSVMGRVARRIWAKAMKYKYKASPRSQMLKYHIQTSGRSLHAQEIDFNDIRTTLQALYALYDNCNSLHTNAYDEAITTPTEESVRRALAIQLIINKELGLNRNENPLQGSFIIEDLTDLVEQAVYTEFRRINERGGVLGAMERMYQRSKIQDESMHYEMLKHDSSLPIIGVNTFLDPKGSPTVIPREVIRSTKEEKDYAVQYRMAYQEHNKVAAAIALDDLQKAALNNGNVFENLVEASKVCTLGQLSNSLYAVGGQYRRNM
jgi:isobutyryl-CoA mutase